MPNIKRSRPFLTQLQRLREKLFHGSLDNEEKITLANILMTCTTDNPTIVKLPDDETFFLLRAQDETSDGLVDEWCEKQMPRAMDPAVDISFLEKVHAARHVAIAMRAHPNRKAAD